MSFPRLESPSPDPLSRTRSSTLSGDGNTTPDASYQAGSVTASPVEEYDHSFIIREDETQSPVIQNAQFKPQTFEDLPIEIKSLTERYVSCIP